MSDPKPPDTDITLGEVNRNVIRVESAMKESAKQYATRVEMAAIDRRVTSLEQASATREDVQDVRDLIQDVKDGLKSKGTTYLALAGIIVPSAVAIWSVIHR
ncbi:hypothetical protein LQK89_02795 [Curtobacterium sp. C1]|uniref:hypothetical protein n=1 Tax=Curtobacterium sp. C1 TaxID=2898151 RepID=UPI001E2BD60C|nr:hypothetical protein [Curtobacterium sp. C1]UFU14647.1 hypothetical protein LQK89_02795 [Curtobacterium sp. C1]